MSSMLSHRSDLVPYNTVGMTVVGKELEELKDLCCTSVCAITVIYTCILVYYLSSTQTKTNGFLCMIK